MVNGETGELTKSYILNHSVHESSQKVANTRTANKERENKKTGGSVQMFKLQGNKRSSEMGIVKVRPLNIEGKVL